MPDGIGDWDNAMTLERGIRKGGLYVSHSKRPAAELRVNICSYSTRFPGLNVGLISKSD